MGATQLITSFNSGELSPYLDARSDLEKYASGCRLLENFVVMPYGGVYRRPGTEYLGAAKYADRRCRLLGFNFSTTTRFVLEMGELYVRFWSNGVRVESAPGVPLELATPYLEGHLREIQFVQINDVMYFVHPLHSPRKLLRVADTNWTFDEVAWDWPALLDENVEATTITPSATSGIGITLTASADMFEAGHVGAYWQIAHTRSNAFVELAINGNGTSASITVLGSWEITTYKTWDATLQLQRSTDNGVTWETIRSYRSKSDRNVSSTGREEKEVLLRLAVTNYTSNTDGRAMLELQEAKDYGVVKITGVASPTAATADVVNSLYGTTATARWAEGAWSVKRGFPRTVALHEQRLFFGGSAGRPQSVWGSVVNDFENFRLSSSDDAGLFFSLSAQEANPIQWMVSKEELLIGTAGDEWTLGSSDQDSTISPTNVRASRQSSYGSKYMRALIVNDVILFTQRQGRKVRELVYSLEKNGWVAPDLTVLAEHVSRGEIVECAFQQQPDAIYWTITGSGELVGMTYEREQNVVAWHRHKTAGEFESVGAIYGASGADEVWLAVKREINGEPVRYVERFKVDFRERFEDEAKEDWWYLDCGRRVQLDPVAELISELDHLEGKAVDILADGAVSPQRVVEDGRIELQAAATKVLVGLRYDSVLKPMKLEAQLPDGSSRGRTKRANRMVAALYKSLGGEFSSDGRDWNWMYTRSFADPMDQSPSVFTGDREVYVGADYRTSVDVMLRQRQPLPLTLLALVLKWDVYGD